jgi:hypothetical protein
LPIFLFLSEICLFELSFYETTQFFRRLKNVKMTSKLQFYHFFTYFWQNVPDTFVLVNFGEIVFAPGNMFI